jgi:dihydrodipicolinate reductase
MKVALIGYGKMGKEIEKFLLERGHLIALIIDKENSNELTNESLYGLDVAIEFTGPHSAKKNIEICHYSMKQITLIKFMIRKFFLSINEKKSWEPKA